MQIFVTGASGFVGGAFVQAVRGKHQIRAMSRSEGSDARIRGLGVTPVRTSLGEVTADQLAGCETIVHCAAFVEEWGPWSEYWRINVEGTKQLLDAAKRAGVRRFVHIGTEAALFRGQHLDHVDEKYPLALDSPFPYSRTKAFAEKAVREANDRAGGFTTVVVRPRFVWGPGDETLLPVIRKMSESGQFAWIDGGRHKTSTTYIGNLSYAIELALTNGGGGEAYFVLDDEPVVFRDFLTNMARAAGFELKGREVPGWLMRGAAFVAERLWRGLNLSGKPPITRFAAAIMSRDCILSDAKARSEMAYQPPFTVEQGLVALAASVKA
jgi:nucleoside-diphosphate-sugar epimerase